MNPDEVLVTRVREFTPDASIAAAVGRHHTFETAIADLVDNSIDAKATRVLLRFLEKDGAVVGLRVMDNGSGMDAERLDDAMTFGRKRKYGPGALGHFGLGLKAASLSQADVLRVYSRQLGSMPAGRSITSKSPTSVADLNDDHVESVLNSLAADFLIESGTVIEWAEPRTFLRSLDTGDRSRWLDERITSVISHLGTVFHRMISAGAIEVTVDVFDLDYNESGPPRAVTAIDPFGYESLPNDEYPTDLKFSVDDSEHSGRAHIWPAAQSGRAEYRLGGKPGSLAQGFYFYRFDRLLQIGGWNTLTVSKLELEYARIAIDVTEKLEKHVTINPEKAGLELDSDLKQALLEATIGHSRISFGDYLEKAIGDRRESRKYTKRPVTLVEPSRGFGSDLLEAFESTVEFHSSKPIDIRWRVEFLETPLHVDLENRTIWLNEQYRGLIAGPGSMDAADAPFVKTLLVLVFSKYFEGAHLGAREKAELGAWEELLTAALRDQIAREALNMGDEANE
ncbi:ATP-binding protein [Paeniglutamicibacter sp. ZC-3]|uniref:ATP-binding protein n=1 Tax=Paeniglutamicibacter sp. ZC-3 TaxID=2986919 RepID=UPI0021F7CD44|nr:ATP-binding protein [Paeniglutamicibacter sp. ZC-3]MCV9993427.1 ATP-binding protein [Paeniglutamicibacter sp. ZC-3]